MALIHVAATLFENHRDSIQALIDQQIALALDEFRRRFPKRNLEICTGKGFEADRWTIDGRLLTLDCERPTLNHEPNKLGAWEYDCFDFLFHAREEAREIARAGGQPFVITPVNSKAGRIKRDGFLFVDSVTGLCTVNDWICPRCRASPPSEIHPSEVICPNGHVSQ